MILSDFEKRSGRINEENKSSFEEQYPALAFSTKQKIAKDSNLNPNDPIALQAVTKSKTYQERTNRLQEAQEKNDMRTIKRMMGREYEEANAGLENYKKGFSSKEEEVNYESDSKVRQMKAQRLLDARLADAEKQYNTLKSVNKQSFVDKKLQQMNPTAEAEEKILQARREAIVAKELLRQEYGHLPPNMRNQILQSRMGVFDNKVSLYEQQAEKAKADALSNINAEWESYNAEIQEAEERVDTYKSMMDQMQKEGRNISMLSSIRSQYTKAQEKLNRVRDKSGIQGNWNDILREQYMRDNKTTSIPKGDQGYIDQFMVPDIEANLRSGLGVDTQGAAALRNQEFADSLYNPNWDKPDGGFNLNDVRRSDEYYDQAAKRLEGVGGSAQEDEDIINL